jgi:hypothetical protein
MRYHFHIYISPSNPDFSSAEARLSLVICSCSFLVGSLHSMIPIRHRGLELFSSIKKKKCPARINPGHERMLATNLSSILTAEFNERNGEKLVGRSRFLRCCHRNLFFQKYNYT